MKVIDLTHKISAETTVYPGTEPPTLIAAASIEKDAYNETIYHMFSHTGTHIDPPAHIFEDGKTLDSFPASQFVGRALAIDASAVGAGGKITMDIVEGYGDKLRSVDFLLFYTGWGKKFASPEYLTDYPIIDEGVLDFIIAADYKGIGFDVIGLDPVRYDHLKRHKQLFAEKEIINIENLCHLDECGSDLFQFACLPLKYENADGAPARAIAWVE